MTATHGLLFIIILATFWTVFRARVRLRENAPRVRMALGAVGMLIAVFVFCMGLAVLPRPTNGMFSPFADVAAMLISAIFAGLFILSLFEIAGGVLQAIKRWHYFKSNVG